MRIVPNGLALHIDWTAWDRPAIFRLIQTTGNVPEADMRRVFNLGVGLVVLASRKHTGNILRFLRRKGEDAVVVGEVVSREKKPDRTRRVR